MSGVIIPVGAGLIVSVAGYLVFSARKSSVKKWMNARRIDSSAADVSGKTLCGVCGAEMHIRQRHSGKHAGDYWVCSSWPECRKVEKVE